VPNSLLSLYFRKEVWEEGGNRVGNLPPLPYSIPVLMHSFAARLGASSRWLRGCRSLQDAIWSPDGISA
jgi:hypothetical protein